MSLLGHLTLKSELRGVTSITTFESTTATATVWKGCRPDLGVDLWICMPIQRGEPLTLDRKACLFQFILRCSMRLSSGLGAGPSGSFPTNLVEPCLYGPRFVNRGTLEDHAGTGKGLPQTDATNIVAPNCLNGVTILLLDLRGLAQTLRSSPRPPSVIHQTVQVALYLWPCNVLLAFCTPRYQLD